MSRNELDDDNPLARWSRCKHLAEQGLLPDEEEATASGEAGGAADAGEAEEEALPFEEQVDPRTGKKMKDLTDDDMPPLEELHQDSDLSVFRGGHVSPELRRAARRKVYHSPKFNKYDLFSDSAGDFTKYAALKGAATHFTQWHAARKAKEMADAAVDRIGSQTSSRSADGGDAQERGGTGGGSRQEPPQEDDGQGDDGKEV